MRDDDLVPLDAILRDHEALHQQLGAKLLYEAAQALSAMHSSGTVHGDLRCENVLVAPDLKIHVMGSDKTASELGIAVSSATRWLAPECVTGAVPTPTSDMYTFGLTMYEAMTGAIPFDDKDDTPVLELKKRKETRLPDRHLEKSTASHGC